MSSAHAGGILAGRSNQAIPVIHSIANKSPTYRGLSLFRGFDYCTETRHNGAVSRDVLHEVGVMGREHKKVNLIGLNIGKELPRSLPTSEDRFLAFREGKFGRVPGGIENSERSVDVKG